MKSYAIPLLILTFCNSLTAEESQRLFDELAAKSGTEYIRARGEFLASAPPDVLTVFLKVRRESADNPVRQLWLESLMDRIARPGHADQVWRNACEEATLPKPTHAGLRVLPPAYQARWAASRIISELGAVAAAYAAEYLEKGLAPPGSQVGPLVPVSVLRHFGIERDPRTPARDRLFFAPRDRRAGYALLHHLQRLVNKGGDPLEIRETMAALGKFIDPELLQAARAARDQLAAGPAKDQFSDIATQLEDGMVNPARVSSRPGDLPDEPVHLGPPPGWRERLKSDN